MGAGGHACGKPPYYTVLLVRSEDEHTTTRYYLPNQHARSESVEEEVPFCRECLRRIEDAMRATIIYIQIEACRPPWEKAG